VNSKYKGKVGNTGPDKLFPVSGGVSVLQSPPFLARFNVIERWGGVLSITCFVRVFGRYPVHISPWRPSVPFQFLRGVPYLLPLPSQFVIVNNPPDMLE
jgi:hypothetical protein